MVTEVEEKMVGVCTRLAVAGKTGGVGRGGGGSGDGVRESAVEKTVGVSIGLVEVVTVGSMVLGTVRLWWQRRLREHYNWGCDW